MAIQHFSDLTGERIANEPEDLVDIVVTGHPDLAEDQHAKLEASTAELKALGRLSITAVTLQVTSPGEEGPQNHVLRKDDFDKLFAKGQVPDEIIAAAAVTAVVRQRAAGRPSHNTTKDGAELKNWSDPNLAGLPHQGTVARGEAEYVRAHLDEVNERRTAANHRPIDPSNPVDAKKYGFTPQEQSPPEDPATPQQ